MASTYPDALDNLPTNRANDTSMLDNHPQDHDDLADAVNNIEAEFGLTPRGQFATVKERLDSLDQPALNTQTDDYTLVLTDFGKIVGLNKATLVILTIPLNSSVAFPIGTQISVRQVGAGQVQVVGTGGVTVHSRSGVSHLAGQYAYATMIKVDTDTWELTGDLV